jgi:hypothetical protein
MVFVAHTMKALEQDNDTWQPLSLATRRLLETCEQKHTEAERDAQRDREQKQEEDERRAYIDKRLQDIAAFEDRYRTNKRRSR